MDPSFLRIAPPRPPSIYADPSQLDLNTLARSLLGRPKCQRDSDRPFIDGTGFLWIEDKQRLVVLTRDLFQNFAAIACGFPEEQVEQGLWYLFGEPFWLSSLVVSHDVPETLAAELTQAMMFPFSDYYMSISAQYSGSAFFMWWDLFSPACANPAIGVTALSVLERILALPNKECQVAALHGLSHLHPDPRAGAIIQRYLDQNLDRLSDDELAWVKGCLAGEVP